MTNKYWCTHHKLDICCLGCVQAWIARHDKLLEFVKQLATYDKSPMHYSEAFLIFHTEAHTILKELNAGHPQYLHKRMKYEKPFQYDNEEEEAERDLREFGGN